MPDHYVHVAVAGETWDSIAYDAYLPIAARPEHLAHRVAQANPDLLDVVVFEGGESVRVPVLSREESPETLPPWRR